VFVQNDEIAHEMILRCIVNPTALFSCGYPHE
jgi:hypothetical protein